MRKIVLGVNFMVFIFFSCTGKQKGENENNNIVSEQIETVEKVTIPSDSGIIHLKLVDGKNSARIEKKENQTIYVEFVNEGYEKVIAHLSSSDSLANIRFSQIFLPDKTMDGPFGRDIKYQLPTDGLYKLSVNENMMAGDPWAGIFDIHLQLEK